MWVLILAFGASFLLILTTGVVMFYRSTAHRRLSQYVGGKGRPPWWPA